MYEILGTFAKLRNATFRFVMPIYLLFFVLLFVCPSLLSFFRSFIRSPLCLSFHPSVPSHETTRLPLKRFSWNFKFEYFSKVFREYSTFIKIWREYLNRSIFFSYPSIRRHKSSNIHFFITYTTCFERKLRPLSGDIKTIWKVNWEKFSIYPFCSSIYL